MPLLNNDPMTQLAFSVYENKGVFAILIGSGLSRAAEIPTGWEITLDLIRRVAMTQGVAEQPDWATWYKDETGEEPNYSSLLEDIASSPDERRSVLHSYIEPTEDDRAEGKKIPTGAHIAIAQLVRAGYIRVIITTNFDRLMENALREHGVEPTVISSTDVLQGAEPLTHSQCYLLKLHGDYKDARILNTDRELSVYPDEYNRLLDRIFDEHGLIICGWSGEWDHALRSAVLRAPNRRYPTYWAIRGNFGAGADEIVSNRRAKAIRIANADDFFATLYQRVETLEKTHRQSPLSIDLLISGTKRYLSKTEYRIQLDELISQETERLLAQLETLNFAHHSPTVENFQERVHLYEAITEPLARMVGVLGRWGDGSELGQVLDIIKALLAQASKIGNGLNIWLGMRSYPAVLIFTAYSLGLTKAQRWQTLHQLFATQLSREYHEPGRVVSTLFLQSWKGGDDGYWQYYLGLDKRLKTPLSDHLLEIMTEWKSSFIGVEPNFELLFERFESLGSLAYFEDNDEAELEKALAANPHQILAGMPVGRIGWHSSSFSSIEQEFAHETTILVLLSAGFANGKRRILELFLKNFRRISNRMW